MEQFCNRKSTFVEEAKTDLASSLQPAGLRAQRTTTGVRRKANNKQCGMLPGNNTHDSLDGPIYPTIIDVNHSQKITYDL
jgi:hypothetical protein